MKLGKKCNYEVQTHIAKVFFVDKGLIVWDKVFHEIIELVSNNTWGKTEFNNREEFNL